MSHVPYWKILTFCRLSLSEMCKINCILWSSHTLSILSSKLYLQCFFFYILLHFKHMNKLLISVLVGSFFCPLQQIIWDTSMKYSLLSSEDAFPSRPTITAWWVCLYLGQVGVSQSVIQGRNASSSAHLLTLALLTRTLPAFLASTLIKLWLRIRLRVGGLGGNPNELTVLVTFPSQ